MKTKIKQYILKAVGIEIFGTILLFSFFYTLFFGSNETIKIFHWLWLPIFIGCALAFGLAWVISDWFSENYNFKKRQGVIIIFGLLISGVIAGTISLSLSDGNDINDFSDFFSIIIVFLLFGGIPTIAVGLWLGNRLKSSKTNK